MKNNNYKYVLDNLDGNNVNWLYDIKDFFNDEQVEQFCDFYINTHHITRKNDIRNMINHNTLSVYSYSNNEQLAFISAYNPFNTKSPLLKDINSLTKIQKICRDKSIKLSTLIKELGYSYSIFLGNWKDKTQKDIYQQEYVFVIYSEADDIEKFKKNIFDLAKKVNVNTVLITRPILLDEPRLKITSKLYEIEKGNTLQEYSDTTIETVEKYLSSISGTKVLFEVPYKMNKKILFYRNNIIRDYYNKYKQDKVKQTNPVSWNTAMIKHYLLKDFLKDTYNN